MSEEELKELHDWLEYEFKYSCHVKYRHLFEEWWSNILPSQIDGFYKQMQKVKHGVLGKTSKFFT